MRLSVASALLAAWCACATNPEPPAHGPDHAPTTFDSELTKILRTHECMETLATTATCERITDLAGWRRLQADLLPPGHRLPEDWCDFGRDCVLFLAFGPGGGNPAARPMVTTEEGVDVITLTRNVVARTGDRSPGLLLVVPRRDRALAIVLRRCRDHTPIDETTLRVFEPLH